MIVWIFMGSNLSLCGGGGGLGVLPKENLEVWSALGAILGLFKAYLGLVAKYPINCDIRLF